MATRTGAALGLALIDLVLASLSGLCHGGALQVGFYGGKCGLSDFEAVLVGVVAAQFRKDPTIAPALLRMQFHDCFVTECDASILLGGTSSEKTAPLNLSVRGYDVIDAPKAAVEAVCPGVVSCADIIVLATGDVVSLSGGGRCKVETGTERRARVARVQRQSPRSVLLRLHRAFAQKGLIVSDYHIPKPIRVGDDKAVLSSEGRNLKPQPKNKLPKVPRHRSRYIGY